MKKYYLVAYKRIYRGETHYDIRVTDNKRDMIVLMEVEAPSFIEASRMFSFTAVGVGATADCGVDIHGRVYTCEC